MPINPNDPVTEVSRMRIGKLYPGLRPIANRVLQDVFIQTRRKMNVVQGLRSFEDQLAVYSQGRQLQGDTWVVVDRGKIVTNARPGLSWHCYGLAFDCAWMGADPYLLSEDEGIRDQLWKSYEDVVRSHGMKAGADFHLINGVDDIPHAELTYGLTIAQALELYNHGGLQGVWAYCDHLRGVPEGQDWGLGG